MRKLKEFDVSLNQAMSEEYHLTNQALKAENFETKAIIKKISYSREESLKALDTYIELLDTIRRNKEVNEYLANSQQGLKENKGDTQLEGRHDGNFKNIDELEQTLKDFYSVLRDNKKWVAAPKNPNKRRELYDGFLKGFKILSEIIKEKQLDPMGLLINLTSIADLGLVCAQGWEYTLTEFMVRYSDEIREKLNMDYKKTEGLAIKRRIDTFFYNSTKNMADKVCYDLINKLNVPISVRPHYMQIYRNYLRKKYGLNLSVSVDFKDSIYPEGSEQYKHIEGEFRDYIKNIPIEEMIINDVCDKYYELLNTNTVIDTRHMSKEAIEQRTNENREAVIAREEVTDWARLYMSKIHEEKYNENKEKQDKELEKKISEEEKQTLIKKYAREREIQMSDDVVEFLMDNVYDEDTGKWRRKAIEEIINKNGYFKKDKIEGLLKYSYIKFVAKNIFKYCETKEELENVKMEIKEFIKDNAARKEAIFDALVEIDEMDKLEDIFDDFVHGDIRRELKFKVVEYLISKDKQEKLRQLLKNDFKVTTKEINLAMLNGVRKGNVKLVDFFIKEGVQLDLRDKLNATLLMNACESSPNIEMLELLVKKGGKDVLKELDEDGNTLIRYACKNKNIGILEYLIKNGIDVNVKNNLEKTALSYACYEGNTKAIDVLIKNGCNVDEVDKMGTSLLCQVVSNHRNNVMEKLIRNGANVNLADGYGKTPLMYALENKNGDAVGILINVGANIYKKDEFNMSVVDYAINNNCIGGIYTFIEKGVDVNKFDKDGVSLLAKALNNQNYNLARYLILHGADVKKLTKDGLTIKDLTNKSKGTNAQKFYNDIKKNIDDIEYIKKACKAGDFSKVNDILHKNPTIAYRKVALQHLFAKDISKNTVKLAQREKVLQYILDELEVFDSMNIGQFAVNKGNAKLVKTLIHRGVINKKDVDRRNPANLIDLSIYAGNDEVTKVLSEHQKKYEISSKLQKHENMEVVGTNRVIDL